jgi:AcrR family transcriptional regulator
VTGATGRDLPAGAGTPAVEVGGQRRAGRPPGRSNTREAVLDAARRTFAARGYEAASLRAIAAEAGVDPGMVRHFFGSKAGLFQAAMALPIDFEQVVPMLLAGGLDGIGERLVRFFVTMFESTADRNPFISLLRSAVTHEDFARTFREFMTEQVLGRVAAAVALPDARLRAALVGSQMSGLVLLRYVIGVEPLASADTDTLVAAVAPTIQRYLTGDLGLAP